MCQEGQYISHLLNFIEEKTSLNHTKLNDNNEYKYISAKSVFELEE
jgi:hypothetical protein